MSGSSPSKRAQATLGLPDGFKVVSAFPFAGMNQSASRTAIDDKQLYWLENYIHIGNGKIRTAWDAGAAFYAAPTGKSIVFFFWFNIGPANYVAVFLNDGTAVQVAYPSGAVTTISATAGLFYEAATGQLPACCQSGGQFLLISNNNTVNDYWIWDGAILYSAGGMAPVTSDVIIDGGSGYTSVPSYTIFGGSGSGIVLVPVVALGSVVAMTVTNPGTGYLPGEIVQVAFSGGGSDTTPILEAVLATGAIAYITLVAGGSGYTAGTFALGFSGGGGSSAAGTFTVVGGSVVSIDLTNPGSDYTSTPILSFAASPGGSSAVAVPALTSSAVASVTVVDGGTNLIGTPTLTIVGGGGSGATAVATVTGGAIVSVAVSNGGSGYSSAPAVEVQTGVNNAAAAILDLMPFGISGTTIEQYQSRVWIAHPNKAGSQPSGGIFDTSAPGSQTDFATSDGGDVFTNTDRFLRAQFTFLRQTSNFLYAVGDSSVSVISNVQTGGNPVTTTFSFQNTDPQTGTMYRDTAQDYSNTILFGNPVGIYGIYGGSVRKVSKDVDDLFTNAVAPSAGGLVPTSAVANLYSQRFYLYLMTTTDPTTQTQRNIMLAWNQDGWAVLTQTPALIQIGTQEIDSDLEAWGTDGTSLYPLFNAASTALAKKIVTKLYGGPQSFLVKMAHSLYLEAEDVSAGQAGISFTTASIDGMGLAVPVVNSVTAKTLSVPSTSVSFGRTLSFVAPKGLGAMYGTATPQVPGIGIGATLVSTSSDMVIRDISFGLLDYAAVA